jgi:hypothetical protein
VFDMPADHDIKVWVDGPTYLALKALAHADHRGLSDYIRHVLLLHLEQVSVAEARADRSAEGPVRVDPGGRPAGRG